MAHLAAAAMPRHSPCCREVQATGRCRWQLHTRCRLQQLNTPWLPPCCTHHCTLWFACSAAAVGTSPGAQLHAHAMVQGVAAAQQHPPCSCGLHHPTATTAAAAIRKTALPRAHHQAKQAAGGASHQDHQGRLQDTHAPLHHHTTPTQRFDAACIPYLFHSRRPPMRTLCVHPTDATTLCCRSPHAPGPLHCHQHFVCACMLSPHTTRRTHSMCMWFMLMVHPLSPVAPTATNWPCTPPPLAWPGNTVATATATASTPCSLTHPTVPLRLLAPGRQQYCRDAAAAASGLGSIASGHHRWSEVT